jgi:hypothetical protein
MEAMKLVSIRARKIYEGNGDKVSLIFNLNIRKTAIVRFAPREMPPVPTD